MRALLWTSLLVLTTLPVFAKYNPTVDCDDLRRKIEARRDFCEQVREHRGDEEAARCRASVRSLPASCEDRRAPPRRYN
ncbi:MAG: hypothetical protein KF767_14810 [Bdellovibrionaceae bacterium]|nr:hypothetical protein [Pseudobdellovibrionaceae bacterium]